MTTTAAFTDARRELRSLTGGIEKRVLLWLAARMPAWVGSDHLTALGLAAMVAAGGAYVLSGFNPSLLHLVNLCLLVNWFGDSLDGTLARYRNRCRPRYGFYIDHMVDMVGALFLLGGLGLSGYMSPWVAVGVLVGYYMLSMHIYLSTYTLGVFKIAYGRLGGTELRLLLALGNLALLAYPQARLFGWEFLLYDAAGLMATAGLTAALVASAAGATRTLYRLERLEPVSRA